MYQKNTLFNKLLGVNIVYIFIVLFVETTDETCKSNLKPEFGKYMKENKIITLDRIGIKQCAKRCKAIQGCLSYNFRRKDFSCELHYTDTPNHSLSTSPDEEYYGTEEISKAYIGSCNGHTCPAGHECVTRTAAQPLCRRTAAACEATGKVFNSTIRMCYKVHPIKTSWTDADLACQNEDARIAVLDNSQKFNHFKNFVTSWSTSDCPAFYVGMKNQANNPRDFKWINGKPSGSYLTWRYDSPSGQSGDDCCALLSSYGVQLWGGTVGEIFDDPCTQKYCYICEIPY